MWTWTIRITTVCMSFMRRGGTVRAYLRAFEVTPGVVKIGRVLTIEHGKGLGGELLRSALEEIRRRLRPEKIVVDAQCHAIGFYEKAGFVTCSEEFLEEGIRHVKMELSGQERRGR